MKALQELEFVLAIEKPVPQTGSNSDSNANKMLASTTRANEKPASMRSVSSQVQLRPMVGFSVIRDHTTDHVTHQLPNLTHGLKKTLLTR